MTHDARAMRGARATHDARDTVSMRRATYVALAVATIAAGLAVHLGGAALGGVARDVAGDALWAGMMVWWVSAIAPARPLVVRGGAAYAIAVAVEVAQLSQAAPLVALRATLPGRLVLGSGFDPRDLAAYAGGVVAAMLAERAARAVRRGRVAAGRGA